MGFICTVIMEEMKDQVAEQLFDLNCLFYQSFGRLLPRRGDVFNQVVRRVLREWAGQCHWLDLGCGSGVLAVEWLRAGFQGSYLGRGLQPAAAGRSQPQPGCICSPA